MSTSTQFTEQEKAEAMEVADLLIENNYPMAAEQMQVACKGASQERFAAFVRLVDGYVKERSK